MKSLSIRERIEARKRNEKTGKATRFSDTLMDLRRNPMILVGLGGSAFFSSLAGMFIGLAPRLAEDGQLVLFGGIQGPAAAGMGVFFALLYGLSFPVLGEYGTYYWHRKASLRDTGSKAQGFIGYGMMVVAGAFTVVTAIAASVIVASLLHTFAAFNAIPEWAQKWTVLIIPISLAFHAGANIWFDHVSKYAEERREMAHSLQTIENESENRIREARVKAREQAAVAMADEYERVATAEAPQLGRATANRTWKHDALELGADDDDVPDTTDRDLPRRKEIVPSPFYAPTLKDLPLSADFALDTSRLEMAYDHPFKIPASSEWSEPPLEEELPAQPTEESIQESTPPPVDKSDF